MSDIQKTINILENIPEEISKILSIMLANHDYDNFEPTVDDFIEALYLRIKIQEALKDVEEGNVMTTEQLTEEMKSW